MKTIWVNRAASFKDADVFDEKYYRNMGPSERLSVVQVLRESHKHGNEGGAGDSRDLLLFGAVTGHRGAGPAGFIDD